MKVVNLDFYEYMPDEQGTSSQDLVQRQSPISIPEAKELASSAPPLPSLTKASGQIKTSAAIAWAPIPTRKRSGDSRVLFKEIQEAHYLTSFDILTQSYFIDDCNKNNIVLSFFELLSSYLTSAISYYKKGGSNFCVG